MNGTGEDQGDGQWSRERLERILDDGVALFRSTFPEGDPFDPESNENVRFSGLYHPLSFMLRELRDSLQSGEGDPRTPAVHLFSALNLMKLMAGKIAAEAELTRVKVEYEREKSEKQWLEDEKLDKRKAQSAGALKANARRKNPAIAWVVANCKNWKNTPPAALWEAWRKSGGDGVLRPTFDRKLRQAKRASKTKGSPPSVALAASPQRKKTDAQY